ncbi:beta-ketoacyl synthase N-terminal-like domain-containing protein [candidate division CSSED10-310 bacterium]|uniref:Beta-ketoacyl synthase N-terminal-like domain-containing protein n=1 Tax=candidate division CSSED10-310 bacterium TaxID=2855610 RepID=A0ABV6YUQ6_UNCC1
MNDVVITGIGLVTPFGTGKKFLLSALESASRVTPHKLPALNNTVIQDQLVGTIPDLEVAVKQLPRKLVKFMSTAAIIGCLAGKEACEEATIGQRFEPERVGIFTATGLTSENFDFAPEILKVSLDEKGTFSEKLFGKVGLKLLNPLNSFKILPNMPPCILSIVLGIKGPNLIFNPWAGQAGAALLEGWRAVHQGEVDCAVVGAADNPAAASAVVYLKQMGLLSGAEFPSAAGAYLVFENRARAEKDHVQVYGVIEKIAVSRSAEKAYDPLTPILGRTFAAAAPVLLATMCLGLPRPATLIDHRGTSCSFQFRQTI